jgi:hypothetical protein
MGLCQSRISSIAVWLPKNRSLSGTHPSCRSLIRYDCSRSTKQRGGHERIAKYYAMCEWFDETCGALVNHIDESGIKKIRSFSMCATTAAFRRNRAATHRDPNVARMNTEHERHSCSASPERFRQPTARSFVRRSISCRPFWHPSGLLTGEDLKGIQSQYVELHIKDVQGSRAELRYATLGEVQVFGTSTAGFV